MKKIFGRKKIMLPLLVICSIAFIAGVPLNDNKTVLEQIAAAFPSGGADEPQQQQAAKAMDDVWEEIQKLAEHNAADSLTLTGVIKLYDNLDEQGIKEQQNFIMQQAGDNQWLRLDSFDRIQLFDNLVLVDHVEKEIVSQYTGAADSLVAAFKILDPQKIKEMLVKDGTTAEITTEEGLKVLNIKPGAMDAVNEYHIYYDPATYTIRKLKLAYTSFPYQDYLDNGIPATPKNNNAQPPAEPAAGTDSPDEEADVELNITEYTIEFDLKKTEHLCTFNFLDNQFFTVGEKHDLVFKGKLKSYKKIN